MHDSSHNKDDINELSKMSYETRDINVGSIGKSTIYFFIFTTISIVLAWFFMIIIQPKYEAMGPDINNLRIPPSPRIQSDITASKDIRTLRTEEARALNSYGWVDKNKGTVHVPIQQAIDLVLAKGLPTRGENISQEEPSVLDNTIQALPENSTKSGEATNKNDQTLDQMDQGTE